MNQPENRMYTLEEAAELMQERYGFTLTVRTLRTYASVGLHGRKLRTWGLTKNKRTTLAWLDEFFLNPQGDESGDGRPVMGGNFPPTIPVNQSR